jgi:hypothetical protein
MIILSDKQKMAYNIYQQKVFNTPSKKANVGDIVLLEEKAFVVSDKKIDSLELRKRALDENINNLKCYKRIEEEEDAIAEYLFTRTVQPKSIDTLMIQSSTFFQGKIMYQDEWINFYCVDYRESMPLLKTGFFYCKSPYLVIENPFKSHMNNHIFLPFGDTKQWVDYFYEEQETFIGDVVRAMKRDVFPIFDKGRWERSKKVEMIDYDPQQLLFCLQSSDSDNNHNLKLFSESPCTCEDAQNRGFIYKCKHQIAVERSCYNQNGRSPLEMFLSMSEQIPA